MILKYNVVLERKVRIDGQTNSDPERFRLTLTHLAYGIIKKVFEILIGLRKHINARETKFRALLRVLSLLMYPRFAEASH